MQRGDTLGCTTVVVTGADSGYFIYLEGTLKSLMVSQRKHNLELVVLDFGLKPEQIVSIRDTYKARVVTPSWYFEPPEHLKTPRNLAYAARCWLPSIVPGFDVYFWIDADIWIQDETFFEDYITPALQDRLVILHEHERVYPAEWRLIRWRLGNMILGYGVLQGLRTYCSPAINNGIFALTGKSGTWKIWQKRFVSGVHKSQKIIFDQHSLNVAIAIDKIPVHYIRGNNNWICSRALPKWNKTQGYYCIPYPPYEKIKVMHLTDHAKKQKFRIHNLEGGWIERYIRY